mgnify:CR=1 FL=1
MEVVVIPLVNVFTVGNAFGIKTLSVHFLHSRTSFASSKYTEPFSVNAGVRPVSFTLS